MLFASVRHKPITLLEIGVQNGGSLEIWDKYFSRANTIVGCDIDPACQMLRFTSANIHIVTGDASSRECARQIALIAPDFDIIIDDGSHNANDVIASFARYFRRLKRGGVYVIEDLHCSYWTEYQGGLANPYSAASFAKILTDIINHEHWGVAKKRCELLTKYALQYDIEFDEDALAAVHSITFLNSLCIIRKAATESTLGPRSVNGRHADVTDIPLQLAGQTLLSPDQGAEPWTKLAFLTEKRLIDEAASRDVRITALREALAERDAALAEQEGRINTLEAKVSALYASTSWRVTAPARAARRMQIWLSSRWPWRAFSGHSYFGRKFSQMAQRFGAHSNESLRLSFFSRTNLSI
jgi:O-antigen biosynthesis protein